MKDVGVERWMRDLRIFRIFEGTNDILKLFIALNGVNDLGKKMKDGGIMGMIKMMLASPKMTQNVHADLKSSAALLEGNIKMFAASSGRLVLKHKKKIIEEQILLNHIAEIAIYLQSMASCISRAHAATERGDLSEVAVANAWCGYSNVQIKQHISLMSTDQALDKSIRDVGIASLGLSGYVATGPIGV